jgi:predicted dehydrogenase
MSTVLRAGVIGLERCWRKQYRPALLALRDRFDIRFLCDQVQRVAVAEANELECDAVAGPMELLEQDEVDVVLLLDRQWYGLWALAAVCHAGKPVFCCPSFAEDEVHADEVLRQLRAAQLPVMMAWPERFAPALVRLRELLATSLGAPRLLRCSVTEKEGTPQDDLFSVPAGLLDCCADLVGDAPTHVLETGSVRAGLSCLFLDFPGGQLVRMDRLCSSECRRPRLHVDAERGKATILFPHEIRWSDAAAQHIQKLRGQQPPEQVLLERFYESVVQRQPPSPNVEDAFRVLGWVLAGARSRKEGRRVEISR